MSWMAQPSGGTTSTTRHSPLGAAPYRAASAALRRINCEARATASQLSQLPTAACASSAALRGLLAVTTPRCSLLPDRGAAATASRRVISNLNYNVSDEDIQELFETCGPIKRSGVQYDRRCADLSADACLGAAPAFICPIPLCCMQLHGVEAGSGQAKPGRDREPAFMPGTPVTGMCSQCASHRRAL